MVQREYDVDGDATQRQVLWSSMAMEGYWRWSFEKNEGGVEIELPWMEYTGLWSYEQEFKCK